MPKCTINGTEVEVKEGATVIEAFKKMDEDIAHYCWHPGLSIAGVCRLCMIDVEGARGPQIACNTVVKEGMVVTNQSEQIKDIVKWGMDFHLINHPLDCPICDQAGECGLQEQYMKFGQYDPEMDQRKVKKRKVVDLGEKVVLDSERCILCSRCVRFTDEVSKTKELGIFNRGDRSEIGTFKDKPLNNKYSLNTVDICPVGALTSKDFRFRQRVWYLKNEDTVCNGCSTGCNIKVYYNEDGLFRVKPEHNEEVNGYWMCDDGRDIYKFANKDQRLLKAKKFDGSTWLEMTAGKAMQDLHQNLFNDVKTNCSKVGVVFTGQYTNEEYANAMQTFKSLGVASFFEWNDSESTKDEFDGLLIRGDKNPNTKGLQDEARNHSGLKSLSDAISAVESGQIDTVFVMAPENISVYPNYQKTYESLSKAKNFIWFGANKTEGFEKTSSANTYLIPMKSYIEKDGTFSYHDHAQKFFAVTTIVAGALTLSEAMTLFQGKELEFELRAKPMTSLKNNHFTLNRGKL